MWLIRDAQLAELERAGRAQLARKLAPLTRAQGAPGVDRLTDATLIARLTQAVERAASYGFTQRSSFAFFASLAIQFGEGFDRHPSVQAALTRPSEAEAARLARVAKLPAQVWEETPFY